LTLVLKRWALKQTQIYIFNEGNVQLDLELDAFNQTGNYGDNSNQAFNCTAGTIPIGNLRYNDTQAGTYAGSTQMIQNDGVSVDFNLNHQTVDDADPSSQASWWSIGVPAAGISGTCNGQIIFIADISHS